MKYVLFTFRVFQCVSFIGEGYKYRRPNYLLKAHPASVSSSRTIFLFTKHARTRPLPSPAAALTTDACRVTATVRRHSSRCVVQRCLSVFLNFLNKRHCVFVAERFYGTYFVLVSYAEVGVCNFDKFWAKSAANKLGRVIF